MDNRRLETVLHHLRKLICPAAVTSLSDGQLLERFVSQRDQAAFELLVRRHGPLVWNLCRRLLGNAADADDAFQATFLVLVRRAGSLDRRGSLAGWLYGVAYRIAVRARANGARGRWRERQAAAEQASETRVDSASGELRQVLDEELSGLPAKYRIPIVLCYLEGKTHAEAASELGWPLGTLKCRVLRARERLRLRLSGRGLTVAAVTLAAVLGQEAAGAEVPILVLVIHSTLKATLLAQVSARSAALAEGVLRTMLVNKIKIAATVVLTVVLLGGGAGVLVRHAGIPEQAAARAGELLAAEPAKFAGAEETENSGLAAVWADLASDDESKALKAVFALAATPKESTAFLKQHLKPVTIDPKKIARLLGDLDSNQFNVREQATQELESMGSYAVPYLRGALDKKPALEVRQRVEQLLERIKSAGPSASVIRSLRAIAVLEAMGSNDARQLLEALSHGRTKALATQEAEAALDRLTERPAMSLSRHYEDLASKDQGAVARAVLALATEPKETTQYFADEVKKKMEVKPAPKGAAKPRDAQEQLKAEAEVWAKQTEILLRAKVVNPNREQPSTTATKEIITRRVGILLEQIGTPEAKQLLEAIKQKNIQFDKAGLSSTTAVSPDGKLKAASEDGSIRVWDTATGKLVWQSNRPGVSSIAFTDDGTKLITHDGAGGTSFWETATGKLLAVQERKFKQ